MALYSYQCEECGNEAIEDTYTRIGGYLNRSCSLCGGLLRRMVTFAFHRGMPGHYNPTVGKYVTGKREFADGLKAASDVQSERTGMAHNYVPVDLNDPVACGVTGEGLDHTKKLRRDSGLDAPPTSKIIV